MKAKINSHLLGIIAILLFAIISCGSPSSKLNDLKEIQKEIHENNNAADDAVRMRDNNAIATGIDEAMKLSDKEDKIIEELKAMKDQLTPEQKREAEALGVKF